MKQKTYTYIKRSADGNIDKVSTYGNLNKLCEIEKKKKIYNAVSRQLRLTGFYTDGEINIHKGLLIKSTVKKRKRIKTLKATIK